jgi:hypothetical protein
MKLKKMNSPAHGFAANCQRMFGPGPDRCAGFGMNAPPGIHCISGGTASSTLRLPLQSREEAQCKIAEFKHPQKPAPPLQAPPGY